MIWTEVDGVVGVASSSNTSSGTDSRGEWSGEVWSRASLMMSLCEPSLPVVGVATLAEVGDFFRDLAWALVVFLPAAILFPDLQ